MTNLLLLLILVSTHLQAADIDTEKFQPHSSFAAEQQYKTLSETNDKLNLDITQLSALASSVNKASECLEKQTLDKLAAQASIDKIKSNFQKFKNKPAGVDKITNSSSYREFIAGYYEVFFNSINPIEECVDSLSFFVKDDSFDKSGPMVMVVDDIIEALQRQKISSNTRLDNENLIYSHAPVTLPPIDNSFERLIELVQLPYDTILKRSDQVDGASRDINALSIASVSDRFDQTKNSLRKFVEAISSQIKTDIASRQGSLVSNNKKLALLDQTMSE